MVHPDPSKVLQENYNTLMDSIQDADTLADRLYAKGVIAFNIKEKVEGCRTAKEKNRALIAAVQQQVGVNPISFQTFIDALKMDKSNESVVSLMTGKGLRFGNKCCWGKGGGGGSRAWGWWRDDSLSNFLMSAV